MQKHALLRAMLPVLLCLAAVIWLSWGFLNLSVVFHIGLTLLNSAVSLWLIRRRYCRQHPVSDTDSEGIFPPSGFTGPVLLVCGDMSDNLFADGPCRTTAQGCWLQVGDTDKLSAFVDRLLSSEPLMAGQLVVMFRCQPDRHVDEGLLRASLKGLRQQIKQLRALSGYPPPVVLSGEFSGPETPWIIARGKTALVCPSDEPVLAFDEWRQLPENVTRLPYLTHFMTLLQQMVMDELTKEDRLLPPVLPFAVALRGGVAYSSADALWPEWLFHHSRLIPVSSDISRSALWHFPDPVMPLLLPFAMPLQGGKTGRRVVTILLLCALAAICLSVMHNRSLIGRMSADLRRWQAIPMTHYEPKAHALHALQQDALLLERWQRQGEPHRYGLGLYPGDRLWLSVQQAIDTYVPPPQVVPPEINIPNLAPQIIRLDSMSLFDSGQSQLKTDSTKMLINSLVGIRAKPGWLIVVSGHTDNTGSPGLNQALSLKRAEAVRNWMRDTGDLPESCFAVQGYGQNRPIAGNDTPEGRALNRRVEISLVPQADACQIPGKTPTSSQDGDVSLHNGE